MHTAAVLVLILVFSACGGSAGPGSGATPTPSTSRTPLPPPVEPTPAAIATPAAAGPLAWALAVDASGDNEVIIHSTDGGFSWMVQTLFEGRGLGLGAIQFLDRALGWLLGGSTLLRTADGGATWDSQQLAEILPVQNVAPGGVWFIDAQNVVLVGAIFDPDDRFGGETVPIGFFTMDGGQTWEVADLPSKQGALRLGLSQVCLTSSGFGIAIGGGTFGGSIALVTQDAGMSWLEVTDQVASILGGPAAVACAGTQDLWTFGRRIFHSRDGGATWDDRTTALPIPAIISDGTFVDSEHGWIVGTSSPGSRIFHTSDGGQTWVEQPVAINGEPGTGIGTIAFASLESGVVLGNLVTRTTELPLALATNDGGATWVESRIPDAVGVLLVRALSMVP